MGLGLVAVLLLALVGAGFPEAAQAGGVKVIIKSGQPIPQGHIHHFPSAQGHIHHLQHSPSVVHRHALVVVVPQPIYVSAPRRCVAPGYWAYSWVPQNYVSNEWVAGYYNSDALWIEAHYQPRVYAWGYYQPYWVPERWTHC